MFGKIYFQLEYFKNNEAPTIFIRNHSIICQCFQETVNEHTDSLTFKANCTPQKRKKKK
jgi:hypothetical protein